MLLRLISLAFFLSILGSLKLLYSKGNNIGSPSDKVTPVHSKTGLKHRGRLLMTGIHSCPDPFDDPIEILSGTLFACILLSLIAFWHF